MSIDDLSVYCVFLFFFFNDTATPEIYTLSLHDALPISSFSRVRSLPARFSPSTITLATMNRSEEHTSELQSHVNLVCRLLLEKKKQNNWRLSPAARRDRDRRTFSSGFCLNWTRATPYAT